MNNLIGKPNHCIVLPKVSGLWLPVHGDVQLEVHIGTNRRIMTEIIDVQLLADVIVLEFPHHWRGPNEVSPRPPFLDRLR